MIAGGSIIALDTPANCFADDAAIVGRFRVMHLPANGARKDGVAQD